MKEVVAVASFFIVGFLSTASAFADDKACMMEGSTTVLGVTTEYKDCIQNDGFTAAQFKEVCDSFGQTGAAIGGEPAKITYMAACPTPAQASCHKLFGQPISGFYYKGDAETLAFTKSGCENQGGTWKQY